MKTNKSTHLKKTGIIVVLMAAACCGTALGIFLAIANDLPQIRKLEDFSPSAVTRVYAADQTLLTEFYVKKREPIPFEEMPAALVDALIATEDCRFYDHSGIDLKGILRAAVADLMAGEFVQGGSTLTQQLAKTLFLTHRKTLMRKLKEAILAVQLERRYTKQEILELYLNQVYFGSGAYGIKAAARTFFGKSPEALSVPECALIAGMPKSPSRYSPLNNKPLALSRKDTVLRQMEKQHVITEKEYRRYRKAPLTFAGGTQQAARAPYFVSHIKKFLKEKVGSDKLYKGGLSVYTTLLPELQKAAEASVAAGLDALGKRMSARGLSARPQAALAALNVKTGGIAALVGGRDFEKSPFNRATSARRQPGSAFKPILYAYALGKGFTQATPILNTPVVFPGVKKGAPWQPENFSHTYSSEVILRQALVHSKNIPAVRTINKLGAVPVAEFAADLGISSRLTPNLSLAMGTSGVTLLELTGAYSVFPRLGKRIEPYGVNRIVDRHGRILWQARPVSKIVMPASDAAIMTDMLKAVIENGTGRRARDISCPVAGKTGTTDDFRDALFVGYSKKIAAGVWTGTDNYTTLGKNETGARAALPIWKSFMKQAIRQTGCGAFDTPSGVTRIRIDPSTGKRLPAGADKGVSALFKNGSVPR